MKHLVTRLLPLLEKIERLTKTDMRYVLRSGFWVNLNKSLALIIGAVLSIGFANLIDPTTYGTYKYVLAVGDILAIFSLTGFGPAVVRAIARGFEGTLGHTFRLTLLGGILSTVGGIVGALYYYFAGNYILALGIFLAGVATPFLNAFDLLGPYLTGKKEFKSLSIIQTVRSAITAAATLTTIFFTNHVVILLIVYFSVYVGSGYLMYRYIMRHYRPQNSEVDPDATRLGIHVSIINGIAALGDKMDGILLFHFLGAAPFALYSFALLIPTYLTGYVKTISTLALPRFANRSTSEVQAGLFRKSVFLFIALLCLVVFYIFTAPFLFHLLFPAYTDAIRYTQAAALLLLFNTSLSGALLDAHMAIREKYVISITSNCIKIGLYIFGIYYFGIWGAIGARILAKIIGGSMVIFFARRLR